VELIASLRQKSRTFTFKDALVGAEEWRFVVVMAIFVMVVTTLPYVYGYISAPSDWQFMGLVFNVSDHAQYFSWYRDFQTENLIPNRMTPEPSAPLFFNLLWWVLARIGLYTGLSYIQVFMFFRLAAAAVFLFMLYYFCSLVFERAWERKVAFLTIIFGSGLGWILVVLKYTVMDGVLLFPLDVYKAGTNTFLSIMAFPHFTLANALILAVFTLILIGYDRRQLKYALAAGIVAIVLGWQHVYDLITVYGVLGVFFVLEALRTRTIPWYLVKAGMILGLLSIWPPFYALYLTKLDPNWQEVLDQFDNAGVFTANPFHMFILVGLPLLVAVLTFDGFTPLKERSRRELFIKTWFLTSFVLAYLPVGYQVHLTNLWQVPVGILATIGLCWRIAPYLTEIFRGGVSRLGALEQAQRLVVIGFVILFSLTNVYLLGWRFLDLGRHQHPYSYTKDEMLALHWLEEHTTANDVVLSSKLVGQYVPVFTNAKAFLAHFAQTRDFYGKRAMVEEFFAADTDAGRRQQILQEYSVDYVFYGPVERSLGDYKPDKSDLLTLAFSTPKAQVYAVILPDGGRR
jgi:hypothetical protein